jgi:hypothetical protein
MVIGSASGVNVTGAAKAAAMTTARPALRAHALLDDGAGDDWGDERSHGHSVPPAACRSVAGRFHDAL